MLQDVGGNGNLRHAKALFIKLTTSGRSGIFAAMQISSRVALESLLAIGPLRGSWSTRTAENSDRTAAIRCSFVRRTGVGPGFLPRTRPRRLIISWKNSKNSEKCHACIVTGLSVRH